MSYLGVKQIHIAAAVSLVIRHLLHQQQESLDSLIVYEKQEIFNPFLIKSERICLQNGYLSSKQAVVRCAHTHDGVIRLCYITSAIG